MLVGDLNIISIKLRPVFFPWITTFAKLNMHGWVVFGGSGKLSYMLTLVRSLYVYMESLN